MHHRRLSALWILLAAVAACGSPSARPALPTAYQAPELSTTPLRRLVLAPPNGPAADAETSEVLRTSIAGFLHQRLGVEVLADDEVGEDVARDAEQISRGVIPEAALVALEQRARADAVLFVRVLVADPYPPQRIALRADLVSTRSGAVLLRHTVAFDAADRFDRERLLERAARRGLGEGRPLGSEIAFLSRRRFTDLAVAALLTPLAGGDR